MTHLDNEIKQLKVALLEMWHLVILQLEKSKKVIDSFDKELYADVKANEKRVDAFELKIDMDCENILALYNPVANDLRFVLAVLKINYNLERIGDYARGTASVVKELEKPFSKAGLTEARIAEMFEVCISMLKDAAQAFEEEDNTRARSVFARDALLNEVNKNSTAIGTKLIEQAPADINATLNLLSIIRKLERVGDQTKNISEEIIFYLEAKVLKHHKKKDLK